MAETPPVRSGGSPVVRDLYPDVIKPPKGRWVPVGSPVTGDVKWVEEPEAPVEKPVEPTKPPEEAKPKASERGSHLLTSPTVNDFLLRRIQLPEIPKTDNTGFVYAVLGVIVLLMLAPESVAASIAATPSNVF